MASELAVATPSRKQQEPVTSSSPCVTYTNTISKSPYFVRPSVSSQGQAIEANAGNGIEHSGLSPRRVQSLPRAWERRPAIPYVPRNEAQKIWKRVPLGVVGITEGPKWRKKTSKLSARPVKTLRVTHLGEDADKENVDYAASKWEEDGTTTPSPRRKTVECGVRTAPETAAKHHSMPVEADDGIDEQVELDEINHGTSSPELETPSVAGSVQEPQTPEDEEATPSIVSDAILPSIELEGPGKSLAVVAHCPAVPMSPQAMGSPAKRLVEALHVDDEASDEQDQDEVATPGDTLSPVNSDTADDGTAFLYAFLSRTRARKEAKEPTDQETAVQPEATEEVEEISEDLPSSPTKDVSVATPEPDDAPSDLSQANEASIIFSPRRSARFTTRLPRAQNSVTTPIATIFFKPLSGPDLAANLRENQSVAVATRQNTRCNKFGAIPVKIRLIQLGAEARVRDGSEVPAEACQTSDQDSSTTRKSKKRKGVCWAETLATYQDGSDPLKDPSVLEEALAAVAVIKEMGLKDEQTVKADPDTCPNAEPVKETLADISMQSLVQKLREQNKDRGGMKKVRRLRRLNGGSVNGTPAPKKFTGTHMPVPVGSKLPTFTTSSSAAEKERTASSDIAASIQKGTAQAEEGVQTRTRSKNAKSA